MHWEDSGPALLVVDAEAEQAERMSWASTPRLVPQPPDGGAPIADGRQQPRGARHETCLNAGRPDVGGLPPALALVSVTVAPFPLRSVRLHTGALYPGRAVSDCGPTRFESYCRSAA
jgi:hypothetical protein